MFTAVRPPPAALDHLRSALRALPPGAVERAASGLRGFRLAPARQWHVTLRFHGTVEPAPLLRSLERDLPAAGPAPLLRLAGAGTFRGVLWVGVETAAEGDTRGLRALVRAAGGDPETFRAHLTLARWNGGHPDRRALTALLSGYAGPWWEAADVALLRSDPGPEGSVHREVRAVPVPRRSAGDQGPGGSS
ncbi:2'-5' RNA ligase family protein [Saccharopolyspora sp. MS10]|uniref:2'-5' RNA ligase family protein n=1 Tax=Saccharopolyspora sp. MS10 TaxID=3385973 RepID=UPI0039A1925A